MNEQTAQKAAKWWADQLRGNAKLDNGDDSPQGGMVAAMAMLLQSKEKTRVSDEAIDKFEQELAKILIEKNTRYLGVDYHPDHILSEAADRACLPLGMTTLPWKTSMYIDNDEVRVSCGYGAPSVTLD